MTLDIHFFGAKVGESIVIRFPNDKWAMVDCYARNPEKIESNPALQFLKSQEVKELLFACLTHPHSDHYSGMRQVFEELKVAEFWYAPAMSTELLSYILKIESERLFVARGVAPIMIKETELTKLFDIVGNRESRIIRKAITLGWSPPASEKFGSCSIRAIAPSAQQLISFERELPKSFDGTKYDIEARSAYVNRISIALRLEFGSCKIILGGDVEQEGWRNVLEEERPSVCGVHLFKVPHHGGSSSYVDELWQLARSDGSSDLAVVTPYASKLLPHSVVLDCLRNKGRDVLIAGTRHEARPSDSPLSSMADFAKSLRRNRVSFDGRISVYLSENGEYSVQRENCTEHFARS